MSARTRTLLAQTLLAVPLACGTAWLTASPAAAQTPKVAAGSNGKGASEIAPTRPRVIVTTDGEQDDLASMHRFILYTNDFDVAGIIETSSRFHHAGDAEAVPQIAQVTWLGSDWIYAILRNYAKAYPKLRENSPTFPTPEYLESVVKIGNISDVGEYAKNTEGSEWIKKILLDDDPRPVYISVWGGTNVVAAALRSIRDEFYGTPDWQQIHDKVSKKAWLIIDLDQDSTYKDYIAKVWPDVNVVMNNRQFGAFAYRWEPLTPEPLRHFFQAEFQATRIRKGPIGADYSLTNGERPNTRARDWYTEGDTPMFMTHFPFGLADLNAFDPTWGGWGGRFTRKGPNLWVDNPPYLGFTGAQTSDYSPYTGAGDFPATTLATAAPAGASVVYLANVANLSPRDVVTLGTGTGAQRRDILQVGTAQAAATRLSASAAAGVTNVKVDSAAGIVAGDPIVVGDTGGRELRTVERVGSAATRTTLTQAVAAGATSAKLGNTANLAAGDALSFGAGPAAETVTVTTAGNPSTDYTVAYASTTLAVGATTLSEAAGSGATDLRLAGVTNFLPGQTVMIGSGAAREEIELHAVGVGGGTTLGLPATTGSRNLPIVSTANFLAGTPVWVGSGSGSERGVVSPYGPRFPARGADQEGTRAAGASTLSAPSAAGARLLRVENAAGFLVGAPVTVGSGETSEAVHVSYSGGGGESGTAGAAEVELVEPLKFPHPAGSPIHAAGVTLIDALAHSHPAGTSVTSSGATLARPLARAHPASEPVVTVTPGGTTTLKLVTVTGFEAGRTIVIDSGGRRETAQIAAVGTAGLGGTGLTLVAPTKFAHGGAATIEQIGAEAGTSAIKLAAAGTVIVPTTAPVVIRPVGAPPPPPPAPPAGAPAGLPPLGGGGGSPDGRFRLPAPPPPIPLPDIAIGDRITIGDGGDAEQVTVTAVGTGNLTGTGVRFTPLLRRSHEGNVRVHDEGRGVTFSPALRTAYPSGNPVSATGTGISFAPALSRAFEPGAAVQGQGSGVVLATPLTREVAAGDTFRNEMNPYYPQTRWTAAVQNDFAARTDWQIRSYAQANHAPIVSVPATAMTLQPGQVVQLKGAARDPDGNALKYTWWQYREPGTYPGLVTLSGADTPTARLTVPRDARPGETIHLIFEVEDKVETPMTRYQRVIVTVAGG